MVIVVPQDHSVLSPGAGAVALVVPPPHMLLDEHSELPFPSKFNVRCGGAPCRLPYRQHMLLATRWPVSPQPLPQGHTFQQPASNGALEGFPRAPHTGAPAWVPSGPISSTPATSAPDTSTPAVFCTCCAPAVCTVM
ncbi:hypothetical protein P7K49_004307 [Saguinus oedipus]|uniref:Uncharacterized protein n=1 Tax=Saguinus oedipus TaxID=9490 RepID=A0ABQ9W704_SAGOE|nr:hypothetical protein P7K49_004307 [Saguinus oedipus]